MDIYTILVVEDDEIDQMNIKRAFERVQIVNPLIFANDGFEALDLLNSGTLKKPLLILLDINMPRLNGLEFLHIIRNKKDWQKDIPVVILTTSNAERDRFEAYNQKVAGYIVKPVEFTSFVEAVAKIESYWSLCEFPPILN
jgi:CheY-like chemotaxis protein